MTDIICDLPIDDRPREKLLMHGPSTLSNAELIGILLGCGTRGKNAIQLARELLSDGIDALGERETAQMVRLHGMGGAKAARVAAAFEIARRFNATTPDVRPAFDLDVAGASLVRALSRQRQERLGAYLLDSRQHVIRQREIFIGTVNQACVSTRDVVIAALDENAVGIVLYHNHPSGNPTPSAEDITFTRKLNEGLTATDLDLIDHLVIGAHGYVSMKRKNLY